MEATESRDDEPKTSDVNAKHGQVAAEDPFAANRLLTFGKNNAVSYCAMSCEGIALLVV